MNRERGLIGVNSYAKYLGFDPLDRLPPGAAWLDLCCGSGRALLEAVLQRALTWLSPQGTFAAHLDLANVSAPDQRWRRGLAYDRRRGLLTRVGGPVELDLPYTYLGADDKAGPNHTGQPAVTSYYRIRAH